MAGELHIESFAEKVVRHALANEGNKALASAENMTAQGRHEDARVLSTVGMVLLDVSGSIANAFRTGLLPGTGVTK